MIKKHIQISDEVHEFLLWLSMDKIGRESLSAAIEILAREIRLEMIDEGRYKGNDDK